jgi:hypothetical protein
LEIAESKAFALSPLQSFRWNFRFQDREGEKDKRQRAGGRESRHRLMKFGELFPQDFFRRLFRRSLPCESAPLPPRER